MPSALPQGGAQAQTQSPAADESLAQAKLEEEAARRQQQERLDQEQEQQQDLLRLQEAERAHAAREQEKVRQRQLDVESAANLRNLQEAEARAKAPASQSSAPDLAATPPPLADPVADESLQRIPEPQAAIPSSEQAVENEAPLDDLTSEAQETTYSANGGLSPTPQLAKARAKAAQTEANLNAYVNAARKRQAKTPAPAVDPEGAAAEPPGYIPTPPPAGGGKGKLPKTPASPPVQKVPEAAAGAGGPAASSTGASAAAITPRPIVDPRPGKKLQVPFEIISRIIDHTKRERQKKNQPPKPQVRKPSSSRPAASPQSTLEETWEKLRTELDKPRDPSRKKLYAATKLPRPRSGSPSHQPTRPPSEMEVCLRRIQQVNEGKREKQSYYLYESGADGHGGGIAPRLSATDGEILVTAKFDGRKDLIMIDRKVTVSNSSHIRWLMLRQSLVAVANGFTVRWEVPDAKQAGRVRQIISKLGLNNVDVTICK